MANGDVIFVAALAEVERGSIEVQYVVIRFDINCKRASGVAVCNRAYNLGPI